MPFFAKLSTQELKQLILNNIFSNTTLNSD